MNRYPLARTLPCCGSSDYLTGPRGGESRNVKCADCGHLWNVTWFGFEDIDPVPLEREGGHVERRADVSGDRRGDVSVLLDRLQDRPVKPLKEFIFKATCAGLIVGIALLLAILAILLPRGG